MKKSIAFCFLCAFLRFFSIYYKKHVIKQNLTYTTQSLTACTVITRESTTEYAKVFGNHPRRTLENPELTEDTKTSKKGAF